MLEVTATEFKLRLGYYLDHVSVEDVWITKNGKRIARLVDPNVSSVDSITGILKGKVSVNADRHALRDERITRYAIDD